MRYIKSMSVTSKLIACVVVLVCLGLLAWALVRVWRGPGQDRALSFSELMSEIEHDRVAALTVSEQQVVGRYRDSPDTLHAVMPADYPEFYRAAREHNVDLDVKRPGAGFGAWVWRAAAPLLQVLTIVLLIAIFVLARKLPKAGDEMVGAEQLSGGVSFESIGGLKQVKDELAFVVKYLRQPNQFHNRKLCAPKVLLIGPEGTGKTLLARALAREARCPIFLLPASRLLLSPYPSQVIRDTLQKAKEKSPAVLLIERIDRCAGAHDLAAMGRVGGALLSELAQQLEGLGTDTPLVVVATACNPEAIPAEMVGPGGFEHRVRVPAPDKLDRKAILEVQLGTRGNGGQKPGDLDLDQIAARTAGFSGAELTQLYKAASLTALREEREPRQSDFDEAALAVARHRAETANGVSFVAARTRLQAADSNAVSFEDVGGADAAKEALQNVVRFLRAPEEFARLDAALPRGFLLAGPPGTGKTLLAQAVAAQAQCPFFSISGSAFIELFVGVGASRIRDLFERAQRNAPCIVFIDELDALAHKRSGSDLPGNREQDHAVNEFLTQLDGFTQRPGVVVIAATNRPDMLDPAVTRPGRFDRQINMPLPDRAGREQIFRIHLKRKQEMQVLAEDVSAALLAERTEGFSGADIAALINESAIGAACGGRAQITMDDFTACLNAELPTGQRLAGLDQAAEGFIVGHAAAKAAVCGLAKLHYSQGRAPSESPDVPASGKCCLLLLGPRGTGKTTLVRRVAAHLGVPFYSCPASRFAAPDPYGRTPAQLLMREVLAAAGGDVKRAEQAVVCLGGLERLLGFGSPADAQDGLARLIKGAAIEVSLDPDSSRSAVRSLRTHRMLFFLEGNLEELEAVIKRRYQSPACVSMKKLVNDEEIELMRHGLSVDLMNAISTVATCSPLSEGELEVMLAGPYGAAHLGQYQAALDACGAPVRLAEHAVRIAKKAYGRREEGASITNVLRDVCASVLSRPAEQAPQALEDALGSKEEGVVYDNHYQNIDPAMTLAELPLELGAVTVRNLPQRRAALVLVAVPEGAPITETTAEAVSVWLRERAINCSRLKAGYPDGSASGLAKLRDDLADYLERTREVLAAAGERRGTPGAARAVGFVVTALEKGNIDQLKALVLLRGISARLGYDMNRYFGMALPHLIQAQRSLGLIDLVKVGFELYGGALDDTGRSSRVTGATTALKDGLAEIEGYGLLADEGGEAARTLEPERVAEALVVTPNLKAAVCDVVARLRESLGLPVADLDGIAARREWLACRPRLERRGDLRNTPNLMLLLAATDACVKALCAVTPQEGREMVITLQGHVWGRADRAQARLQYWLEQLRGLQQLLRGEKRAENLLLWQHCGFDPDRMRADLSLTVFAPEAERLDAPPEATGDYLFDVLAEYYGGLCGKAIALCERHLAEAPDGGEKSVALLADAFDAEAIAQHCTKNSISYITVVPATR